MDITAIIERANDGYYSIYIQEDLDFGLIGTGQTVADAKADFMICIDEMKELYQEEGKEFPELSVNFLYDTASFLQYYSKILSLAGLERLTGVNQGQLSHYLTGHRKPSEKTAKKIQEKIHDFGKELLHLEFA